MPLQSLYLEADSLRVGANQFLTQANAVYVGNNLHIGNTLIFGSVGGGANNLWMIPAYSNNKVIIAANNNIPFWGAGAIDLRVGTVGGRVGMTFSSNTNAFSDAAYIYFYDNNNFYSNGNGESAALVIGITNDFDDVVAIEASGGIFLNPGAGASPQTGAWQQSQSSNTLFGNVWVGNSSIKYLVMHEGLSSNTTIRAPLVFANTGNVIYFTGASNTNIQLRTNDNGILSFDGGAGSLLSISNTLTGQIFSVNDISGYPIIEAQSNGQVNVASYFGNVFIGSTTSTITMKSNSMFIAANGNVGIANVSPTSRLHITGNTTLTALTIDQAFGAQQYMQLPGGVTFRSNGAGELDVLGLGELRFSNGTSYDYDTWAGIKYVTANNSLFIGGPSAPFSTNAGTNQNAANIAFVGVSNFTIANTSANKLYVSANGNIGIGGNTTPADRFVCVGGILYTGTARAQQATLTDGATISWDTSSAQVATVTLAGNRTVAAPSNLLNGAFYALEVIQDATGSRTLAWNSVFKWTGAVAPTLSTAANARDYFVFRSNGTNLYEQGRSLGVA